MVVALVYFAYLAGLALFARQIRVAAAAVLILAAVGTIGMPHLMPLMYLLVGYWLPARLVTSPNDALTDRLLAFDHQLFGRSGLETFLTKAPRAVVEYLEIAYLLCYAVIPIGWTWLVLAGHRDQSDRFWATVLLASFSCYGILPWLPSRAPRAVEGAPSRSRSLIRQLNIRVLDHASVQWNTFPSGHTAASLAVALAVGIHVPPAGVVLGIIAVSIAIGSVVGRYHYAADAIAAAVIAIAAFAITSVVHVR